MNPRRTQSLDSYAPKRIHKGQTAPGFTEDESHHFVAIVEIGIYLSSEFSCVIQIEYQDKQMEIKASRSNKSN